MTITSNGRVLVLAKNSREGNNRQNYYDLAIMIDGKAGNISCTEDAYNKAVTGEENGVVYAFNEQYKSFRIVDVVPVSSVPDNSNTGSKPDNKADKPSSK